MRGCLTTFVTPIEVIARTFVASFRTGAVLRHERFFYTCPRRPFSSVAIMLNVL